MSRSTWQYRQHPRPPLAAPVPQSERAYESRIGENDRARITELVLEGWANDHSVDHAYATAWDTGVMFASRRTWWRVEDREVDHLASDMFQTAIVQHGAPRVVHADSGAAMKSNLLRDFLTEHGVELSHNRPYVSNDNPFSESGFRTMKYRPGYPRVFASLDPAGDTIASRLRRDQSPQRDHTNISRVTPHSLT